MCLYPNLPPEHRPAIRFADQFITLNSSRLLSNSPRRMKIKPSSPSHASPVRTVHLPRNNIRLCGNQNTFRLVPPAIPNCLRRSIKPRGCQNLRFLEPEPSQNPYTSVFAEARTTRNIRSACASPHRGTIPNIVCQNLVTLPMVSVCLLPSLTHVTRSY